MVIKKKKIAYILTDSRLGGTERFLLKILKKIDKKKYKIIVITLIGDKALNKKCDELKIENYYLNFTKLNSLVNFFKLKKIISQFKPEIIHSFLFHANYFSAHLKKSLKYPLLIISERCLDLKKSKLKIKLTRFYSRYADFIAPVSEEVRDLLLQREKIDESKIIMIKNGIDPNDYNLNYKSTFRETFNIPPEKFVILNIARFRQEKGHYILVRAFKIIHKKFPESVLVLVGDGEELSGIKRLVKKINLENVIFTGERHDIMNILKGSDLSINSSFEEGFSAFNLESILAEVPLTLTDVGGNREILKFGIGVPIKRPNITSISNSIESVILNYKNIKSKTKRNKELILKKFSFKNILLELEKIYEKI
ncbi:glycosyltransferase [Candidatus Dependentiae bacterium]|nr:glycosyltransferase [Candidatus Dependentiae bacterium]